MELAAASVPSSMFVEHHTVTTPDGWTLQMCRGVREEGVHGVPVVFVPGFGMNSWIFRYHPRGRSFMEVLLEHGLDPWSVDLRGLSTAKARAGAPKAAGLADYAYMDLPSAFDYVARTTGHERVHGIGCSLGGAVLYAYGSTLPKQRLDRLVTMATPLKWTRATPLVRVFGMLTPVIGLARLRGTRGMARMALPVVSRVIPGVLSVYLNPEITDISGARDLARTVEDPSPRVNRQIGRWIQRQELEIGGTNIHDALHHFDRPLLVVAGNADGICPPENAMAALEAVAGPGESMVIGHEDERVAHADLLVSDIAPERVFAPIARWLRRRL
jgi:pimeloyl-ACP methyl ester carboxylesterase